MRHGIVEMKLPEFPFRKKAKTLSRKDERVFAEASVLAQLRLEQCLADFRIWVPGMDMSLEHGQRPIRKLTKAL